MKKIQGLMVIAIVAVASGWIGAALSKHLTVAQEAIVPDETFSAGLVEAREFRLADGAGNTRASFTVVQGQPHSAFWDEEGKHSIRLKVSPGAQPRLAFEREDGTVCVALSLIDYRPEILFCDIHEVVRAVCGLRSGGLFGLQDEHGAPRLLVTELGGKPEILIFDAEGKLVWEAP